MQLSAALPTVMTLPALALAVPAGIGERSTTMCGQWDSTQARPLTLYNNLWGRNSASSGSECSTFNYANGNSISWSTSWSWAGGKNSVKSFPNARITVGKTLSAIKKLPSIWHWSYSGSNVVADVSYDMFTGDTFDSTPRFEIMVWLGALGGAGPISSTGRPIATPEIDGIAWYLYSGSNGVNTVFSFVAPKQQTSFSGDLKPFFNYLQQKQGLPENQVLQTIGAGTEPFTGTNAVFSTSQYYVATE